MRSSGTASSTRAASTVLVPVVVAQDPSPGMPIGEGDAVLGVVKYGEPRVC
jgi:hypothetical protein